jgi:TolB-like protein
LSSSSPVEAVRCAGEIQKAMRERKGSLPEDQRIEIRVGINLGDVIIDEDDVYGDGVNIAARLEALADPGGVVISSAVFEQVRDRVPDSFEDLGDQQVKNIARPVRVYRVATERRGEAATGPTPLPLPDKPSIAVLPFANISGDPEQEYFADGMVEEIITALSRIRWLFVIARNSSFTYKGQPVDVRQVGRELRCPLCPGRLSTQGGRPGTHHRAVDRRDQRGTSLGRPLPRLANGYAMSAEGGIGVSCRSVEVVRLPISSALVQLIDFSMR